MLNKDRRFTDPQYTVHVEDGEHESFSERAAVLIGNEDIRQREKWGKQTHSLSDWLMFTTEELGELAQAIAEWQYRSGTLKEISKEAVQVATLAIKIAIMAEREKDK